MTAAAASATLVYGILVVLGGAFGYLKARSKPSLIMGVLLGLALIVSGFLGLQGWGSWWPVLGVTLTAFLLVFFGYRFARKRKFMPAGMLATLSLVVMLLDVAALVVAPRS